MQGAGYFGDPAAPLRRSTALQFAGNCQSLTVAEGPVTINSARVAGANRMSVWVTSVPRRDPSCEPVGTPSRPTIRNGWATQSYCTCRSMIVSAEALATRQSQTGTFDRIGTLT